MIITNEKETKFEKENNCHECEKSLMDLPPILVKKQRILNEIEKNMGNIRNKKYERLTILNNKIDVLLLTDVMENYSDVSIKHFKLDSVHYYKTPGFAWNAMHRKT
ncbi:Hypothetical protein CINCED_3A016133, partial [Cinara cedri]